MQLREDIQVLSNNKEECPINDWLCKYFENGGCRLNTSVKECSHIKNNNDKTNKKILG